MATIAFRLSWPLSFVLLLLTPFVLAFDPTDTWRDADVGQSSYKPNHNMDPAIIDSASFGLLWKQQFNANEQFYAKPLLYTLPGKAQLVFIASSQNWIRTLDAKTGTLLKSRQVHAPFLQSDIGCTDIPNFIGIIGTPTIDTKTDIAYFFSKSYIPNYRVDGDTGLENGVYYFHGVDMNTLEDVPGYPILVDGSIADNDSRFYFYGGTILQRPSLLQVGNVVYGGFGGHCDLFNYTGTVIGVDVVQKKIVANWAVQTGPNTDFSTDIQDNSGQAGIWQSGLGLSSDGSRLFFVTGNGKGHENVGVPALGTSGCRTLGEAAINLAIQSDGKLTLTDYFQPYDYINLDGGDRDFGSGGLSLLDPSVFKGTGVNRMALTAGKGGKIYVLNADNLGGYKQGSGGTDGVIQTIVTNKAVFGGAGSYPLEGGYIYYTPVGQPTYAYKLGFDGSGVPVFSLAGQSAELSAGRVGVGIPTVTSYKGRPGTGIVWMTDPDVGLRAWYAVPDSSGKLKPIKMPQIRGANKFQRTSFGNSRAYTADSQGTIYCLGSPVNLPLNCTDVNFGDVSLGQVKTVQVNCTALITTTLTGAVTEDKHFVVRNDSLPKGQITAGTSFNFPATWNLTNAVIVDAQNASYKSVTPGVKSTPLTLFTVNALAGYTTTFPLSLLGNQVSKDAFLDVAPPTLDFGGLVLGVAGEAPTTNLPFTISNLGAAPLTIQGYAWTHDAVVVDDPGDAPPTYTNATFSNGVWNLGLGFTSQNLPPVGTVLQGGTSQTVSITFNATNGTGEYLSYLTVFVNGGKQGFTILEGSASTSPVATFAISTSEGGWLPSTELTMDFGAVQPGKNATRQIRICNEGGSVLMITKSKPPLGTIRATAPGLDLHESQTIPVGTCAYGTVIFAPNPQQVNIPDFTVTNMWTLNTDDLSFGVHYVNMTGIVHSRQVGPLYSNNATAKYTYLGCYQDQAPRINPKLAYSGTEQALNENDKCLKACGGSGSIFAGTEYKKECYCGNNVPEGWRFHPEDEKRCAFPCAADATQVCGGDGGYISIFYDQSKFSPNNKTFDQTPPNTIQSIGAYNYQGCYKEPATGKALATKQFAAPAGGMTVDYCQKSCAAYKYFGVEAGSTCYCADTLSGDAVLMKGTDVTVTGCQYPCTGNGTQYCGGNARINIYLKSNGSATTSSISSSATTSTRSLNATTTTTTSSSLSTSSSSTFTGFNTTTTTSSSLSSSTSSSSTFAGFNTTTTTSSSLSSSTSSSSSSSSSTFVGFNTTTTTSSSSSSSSSSTSSSSSSSTFSGFNTTTTASSSSSTTASTTSSSSSSSTTSSSSSSTSSVSSTSSSSSLSSSSSSSSTSSSTSTVSSTITTSSSAASATPLTCPANNGTRVNSPNGVYLIQCNNGNSGGDIAGASFNAQTFQVCVDACTARSDCLAFTWTTGPKGCYLKNKIGANKTTAGVWGGQIIIPAPKSTSTSAKLKIRATELSEVEMLPKRLRNRAARV